MRDRSGVTTVEIKGGYGLDAASECKMLRAARRAGGCDGYRGAAAASGAAAGAAEGAQGGPRGAGPVRVVTTFLGAHAVPPEFKGRREEYVRNVIEEQLPLCAPHADCVDIFCDKVLSSATSCTVGGRHAAVWSLVSASHWVVLRVTGLFGARSVSASCCGGPFTLHPSPLAGALALLCDALLSLRAVSCIPPLVALDPVVGG
jgi:imidazolonepropionase-like amidohydrolase